jgi:hypothetical protein
VQATKTRWDLARLNCRAKNAYTTIIGSTNEMADVAYFYNVFGGPFWVILDALFHGFKLTYNFFRFLE